MGIGWSFPFIIAPLFGLRFYIVSEQKMVKFLKKLPNYSSLTRNDEPEGWIIGWPFVGYIYSTGFQDRILYIFTVRSFFVKRMKEIDSIVNQTQNRDRDIDDTNSNNDKIHKTINIYERYGCFDSFNYSQRDFNVEYFEPRHNQKEIVDNIVSFYEKNANSVVILHGERGTGKSMIPILIAKALSKNVDKEEMVNFCDTFSPIDPGDQFSRLYNKISPTKNSPFVLLLEEFDVIVQQIHYNKIERHLKSPIMIHDKASWNQFFDRFDRKYYFARILIDHVRFQTVTQKNCCRRKYCL
jgi:hypothetical protein